MKFPTPEVESPEKLSLELKFPITVAKAFLLTCFSVLKNPLPSYPEDWML